MIYAIGAFGFAAAVAIFAVGFSEVRASRASKSGGLYLLLISLMLVGTVGLLIGHALGVQA